MTTKYAVDLTEYERGWGSSMFGTKVFDDLQAAQAYQADTNKDLGKELRTPDYYIRAGDPYPVSYS